MMPFFYDDLYDIIRTLMEKTVVSSVLHESKTASSLCKIDLTKKENLKEKPDVGSCATTEINDLLKKDTVTNESVKSFKKDCITFISSMSTTLLERSTFKYAVIRNSSSTSPLLIATNPDQFKTHFKNFLVRMVQINRIRINDADKTQAEFTKFHSSIVLQNLTRFKNFDKLNDRLDKFFFENIGLKGFLEFENGIVMILCLGQGQASVERVSGLSILIIII